MIHQTSRTTVKIVLEGAPDLVEASAARLGELFTITYQGKNQRISLDKIRRHLFVLPPALTETKGDLP